VHAFSDRKETPGAAASSYISHFKSVRATQDGPEEIRQPSRPFFTAPFGQSGFNERRRRGHVPILRYTSASASPREIALTAALTRSVAPNFA
jgi:hypothetical protein